MFAKVTEHGGEGKHHSQDYGGLSDLSREEEVGLGFRFRSG